MAMAFTVRKLLLFSSLLLLPILVLSQTNDICQSIPENLGVGVCGYNSICIPTAGMPNCTCPRGFSLLDPNKPNGGCKPDFIQGCKEGELSQKEDMYEVLQLSAVNFPNSDYAVLKNLTEEKCNESCYGDCWCAAAVFNTVHATCWKKTLPLLNGRLESNITQTFIKVGKNNSTREVHPNDKKKSQTTLERVESALLGTSLLVNFILASALCIGCFFVSRIKHVRSRVIVVDSNLLSFSYEELQEATNGFSEELGRGSFGVVYKGTIQTGSKLPVAVKKLHFVTQQDVGDVEFKTEVNVIGKIHHKNLVHLVGYCDEGQQRLLVYEFLNNGTLASLLFADVKPSWGQRIEIAYGVAKGLRYLHEECSTAIIHCDIKPQNILLDDYYNARISDFGLAKLLMMNQSHTHTAIRGTKGYVAPEWFRNMPITTKVDVYSFGVVLLEIIFCRRSVDMENTKEEEAILTDWVYDCYREGKLDTLVDHEAEGLDDGSNLEKFVMVGIWCIQEDPSLRPTMKKVVQMLEGVVEVLIPPCPSPYNNRSTIG